MVLINVSQAFSNTYAITETSIVTPKNGSLKMRVMIDWLKAGLLI